MTPNTQSVCTESPTKQHTFIEGECSYCGVPKPVAEPASTGEPPPQSGGWPCPSCGYGHEAGTDCPLKPRAHRSLRAKAHDREGFVPPDIDPRAARPSGPSTPIFNPHKEGIHVEDPVDDPAAPQPVSDPAPSPTPSVSTPGAFRAEFSLSPVETHEMLAMEDKNMIATIIANEFSKQLRQQLTAEQMEGVIRLNAAELDKVGICHTHDFCDGNEIMLHALEALGIERISDELWNEAWSIAKGAGFTPAPSVAGTQPTPANENRHGEHIVELCSAISHLIGLCEERGLADGKHWQIPHAQTISSRIQQEYFGYPGTAQGTPQVEEIASELLDAMETCHICHSYLILQEFPVHCADCSSDCENHDGDECTPIYVLHERLRKALQKRKHGVGAPAQPGPQEKR